MEKRPNLKIELTPLDRAIELACVFTLFFMWCIAICYFFILPDTIPIHFNISGHPDGYGSKGTIFILPVIGLFIFIMITLLNKYPQTFNYPVKITAANAVKQYTIGTRIIHYVKAAVIIIFTIILVATCLTATGKINGLGPWFLPLMLAMLCIPTAYYIVQSYKMAK